MPNKTYAVHTTEEIMRRVDEHAVRIRRSRNSLLNEAIEMLVDALDGDLIEQTNRKNGTSKRKAGAR